MVRKGIQYVRDRLRADDKEESDGGRVSRMEVGPLRGLAASETHTGTGYVRTPSTFSRRPHTM